MHVWQSNIKSCKKTHFVCFLEYLERYFFFVLARPSPEALEFLVQLVTMINHSSGHKDKRSDEQLADEIKINLQTLLGLRDDTPQQTALNIFNYLYPGYKNKVDIGTLESLQKKNPTLLDAMLGKFHV